MTGEPLHTLDGATFMAGCAAGTLSELQDQLRDERPERLCELQALVSIAMGVSAVATLLNDVVVDGAVEVRRAS